MVQLNVTPAGADAKETLKALRRVLSTQLFGVLCTARDSKPYASLVGYAASGDLAEICLATSRATRKFANLESNPSACILIDTRSNQAQDVKEAVAVTVLGTAKEASGPKLDELGELFLKRHPNLAEFLASEDTALVRLKVTNYIFVSSFQDVYNIEVAP